MKKKLLSLLLTLVMIISLCPTLSIAASTNDAGYLAYMGQFAGKQVYYNGYLHPASKTGTDTQTCNICSFTMVLSNKKGVQLNPYDVCLVNDQKAAVDHTKVARAYGYSCAYYNTGLSKDNIKTALTNHPEGIIVGYKYTYEYKDGKGNIKTGTGYHYVVAKQIKNGEILFNDPSGSNRCYTGWTLNQCYKKPQWSQVIGYYVISGNNASGGGSSSTVVDKTINISNAAKPEEPLKQGTIFHVTGTLSSTLPITKVEAYVYDSNNKAVTGKTVTPNTTSYNLASLDNYVLFSKLAVGNYTYKVVAYNSYGAQEKIKKAFKVIGSPEKAWIKVSRTTATSKDNVTLTWGATNGEKYTFNVRKNGIASFSKTLTSTSYTQKYEPGYYQVSLWSKNSVGISNTASVEFVVSDVTTSDNVANGTYHIRSFKTFTLERQSDNTYLIKLNNNYALDAYSGRFNTNLDISKISGDNENRKFYLVKSSGDVYSLVSKKTGQQLYNDGTNVCLKTCSNFYVLEKAVEGVSVQRDSVDVIVGEPYDLSEIMTVLPENASNKDVLWASSDDKIASVNNGIVNGILPGKCTITMTTKDGGYSANCEVTVNDGGNVGGTCGDNITWQIINTPDYYMDQSSILILSGSGSMDNYSGKEGAPWAVYAHRITDVVIGNDITSIGDFAFSNMKKIETIAVPSGVKTIGKHAFDGCGTIERLSLAESVESVKQGAFDNCDISKVSYEGTDREHLSLCSNAQTYGGNDAFCNAEWTCSGGISDEGYLRDVYWKYAENVLTVSSVYSGQTMDQSQGIPWED